MAENIEIPLPKDAKWEAVGMGYASVLMEKQARIDRLEQLLFALYGNVCRGKDIPVLDDGDEMTMYYASIEQEFKMLKDKIETQREFRRVTEERLEEELKKKKSITQWLRRKM